MRMSSSLPLAIFAISLSQVRCLHIRAGRSLKRMLPSQRPVFRTAHNVDSHGPFQSTLRSPNTWTPLRRTRKFFMSSSSTSGVENPMNPNLYTEKAWDAIAKSPQFCDKYSTQYVEAPLLMKSLLDEGPGGLAQVWVQSDKSTDTHIHTYTYMHTHIYTHTHTYINTHIYTHAHTCTGSNI